MGLNTTPRTWLAGETVTAALMNAEVRDALTGIQSAWTSYMPLLTQDVPRGVTVNYAKFIQVGKTISGNLRMTATGTGAAGFAIKATAPQAAVTDPLTVGTFHYLIAATTVRRSGSCYQSGGQFFCLIDNNTNFFGNAPSYSIGVGDVLMMDFHYEVA